MTMQMPSDVSIHLFLQAQMAQLRAMGIQDEAVARHALEASNGDLMVAIQILFGDPNA